MESETVTVMAKVEARPEHIEQVKEECLALVTPSRREEGCLTYDLYQAEDDPAVFLFYESWRSREDLERHLESPHCTRFDRNTSGQLAAPEEIVRLRPLA
jgi:quinol monooxygenase YgiN